MRRSILFIAALALLTAAAPVVPEGQEAQVKRVEDYLTQLTTVVADFNQVDSNGGVASGKFYLKRPGKMRWEYKPPTPILLVSNGRVVTYYDSELDQVNYVAVDDTLAAFLAQPIIKLDSNSTRLTQFSAQDGVTRATIVLAKKPDEGSLMLELTGDPLQIQQMVVTDASGARTTIKLENATFGQELPDELFKFEDPRGITKRRAARRR